MKNILLLLSILFFYYQHSFSQNIEETYLLNHSQTIDLANPSFQLFEEDFYENDLFFFGFVHGSATPQLLDYELLVQLYEKGVRYYAPEVSYSYAYFLNYYLETGEESYLNYVLEEAIRNRVPQDASLEFKEKWKKIYEFNKDKKAADRIKIIGTDLSAYVDIFHIAHLAPNEKTGITLIDSLHFFKKLPVYKGLKIWSGANISKSGKDWTYFFPLSLRDSFLERFLAAYQKEKAHFLNKFGVHAKEVETTILINEENKGKRREDAIFQNFKKQVIPLIEQGEKVYSNYGFSHVLQEKINGYSYLANRLKDSLDNKIKLTTILGLMANSEVLKDRKIKKGEKFYAKGYKFHGVTSNGAYKTSKSWDGDSILARVKGIKVLKSIAKDKDVLLFKLNGEQSPFFESLFFIDYKRYRESLFRKGWWETEKGSSTTDYIQYLFFIQHSKSNRPFPAN